jgi:hypothetical protein
VPQAVFLELVFRQPQVRPRASCHPGVRAATSLRRREPALLSGPAQRPEPVLLQPADRPAVRAASSECHLALVWHLEPVPLQPGERRRGVRAASRQALASRRV